MKKFRAAVLVLAVVLALTAPEVPAQAGPKLAGYFTELTPRMIDPGYVAQGVHGVTEDLNGDGHQDLVALGFDFPQSGEPCCGVPQPGRVLLGDGNGGFALAPASLFPIDTLMTVLVGKALFADFNGDGRSDMFLASEGWDRFPAPGEQNRLYLSLSAGGWRDASATLPQLSDATRQAAAGDISGRGLIDIFVGNHNPGLNPIRPYTLLNSGSGQFTLTSANIPVGNDQLLDVTTQHTFSGEALADLNGDGLPELIIGADTSNSLKKVRRTTILWNRLGVFVETDRTELPVPGTFSNAHRDHGIARIDVDQDGLPDLVVVGTQGALVGSDGWFVQILVNKGNRQFVDETADRVAPGERSAGTEGVASVGIYARFVRVLDFNGDGAPDFSLEFNGPRQLAQADPVIWINDGAGRFSALKVGDFVAPGRESLIGTGQLVATRNGYSFIAVSRSGGLNVSGLLASKRKLPGVGR